MKIIALTAVSAALALSSGPADASDRIAPGTADIETLPAFALPTALTSKAVDAARAKGEAHRFAVSVPVALSTQSGAWTEALDGMSRWRLRVIGDGATTLSARLDGIALPEGASLYVYDAAGALVQGPLEVSDRIKDVWTPLVRGEVLVVEAIVPTASKAQFTLGMSQVFYGYRDLQTLTSKRGACNIDVACSEADAWGDQARSVALMTIAGEYACSAQAVNTAAGDLSPMLLTADHCGLQFDESDGPTGDSIVVYWNFQEAICGGGQGGQLNQFQMGGTLLSRYAESDSALVRLNSQPPAAYNVYFGGIDARGVAPTDGAVVHHPSGEEKSIALLAPGTFPARLFVEAREVEAWVVTYDKGTTERGSSGAGLLNEEGMIVGVLTAGYASCASPDGIDVFGRMDVAWPGGPEPEKTSLRFHLDPQNLCNGWIPGRNAASGPASTACQNAEPDEDRPPEGIAALPVSGMPRGSAADFELTITNPNSTSMTDVAFTLALPEGVRWASGLTRSPGCIDGQLFIQDQQLVMSGMRVVEQQACSVRTQVEGDLAGVYTIGLPAQSIASSFGTNAEAIEATLTVLGYDAALEQFSFAADRPFPRPNEPVTLSWNVPAAASCDAFGEWAGARPTAGSEVLELDLGAYVYRLICRTQTGALERQLIIEVSENPGPSPAPGGNVPDDPSGGGAFGGLVLLGLLSSLLARRRLVAA